MKTKKLLLASVLLLLCIGMARGQKAYTYVQQNNYFAQANGTAAFDISADSHPTVTFVDGKAVMKIGENEVAVLPMEEQRAGERIDNDTWQLCVEFETDQADEDINTIARATDEFPCQTVYSPFQLKMPEDGDNLVFAPTYDKENHKLVLNKKTKIDNGAIIPACTALVVESNVKFSFSADKATDTHKSALQGSALTINMPEATDSAVYVFGRALEDHSVYGFFRYTPVIKYLYPSFAYFFAPLIKSSAKYIGFSFDDDETTDIKQIDNPEKNGLSGKFIDNGRVVIIKNGRKFNLNGQEVK